MHSKHSVSLAMPQIFCFAWSTVKSKPGETPLTQITPALQATQFLGEVRISIFLVFSFVCSD